ncbi:MAG TPA: C39 family peptidase [Desulfomonilia bacterium]|nr:C39 family peptidase [Desulfomonilia bacterium]
MTTIILLLALISAEPGSFAIDNVPFVKQESNFCGPASLASVFAHYGFPMDQGSIAKVVYTEKLKGALITDLENLARANAFQTRLGQGSDEDIKTFLKEHRPVIVLVDLGFWLFSRPHYLVVTGYNEKGFIAHTGYEASRIFPYAEFEKIWAKKGSVYLLVWR